MKVYPWLHFGEREDRHIQRLKKVDEKEAGEGGWDQERSSGDFPQKGNSNSSKA